MTHDDSTTDGAVRRRRRDGSHLWTPGAAGAAGDRCCIQEIFGVGAVHPRRRRAARRRRLRRRRAGRVLALRPGWEADHDEAGLGDVVRARCGSSTSRTRSQDCVAALDALARDRRGRPAAPGVLGFCLGGTLAFAVAAAPTRACCVSYYGSGVPGMLEHARPGHCPTLFHFGNDDPFIPNDGVDAVGAAIAGRPASVLNVEAAGHAFDNHDRPEFHDEAAANAAWTKTVAFLTAHLPPRS